MLYTKVRIDYKYAERGRLYRVFLIKGDPDLHQLGYLFGMSLRWDIDHCFCFVRKMDRRLGLCSFEETLYGSPDYITCETLSDLGDQFDFEYDYGDCWNFSCRRYKRQIDIDVDLDFIVIEGAGQGIWEDNRWAFDLYLMGQLNKNSSEEDENRGIYLPFNFKCEKYGDFDLPLDLNALNEELGCMFVSACPPKKKTKKR